MRTYFMRTKRIGFSLWKKEDIKLAQLLWGSPEVTKYISATGKFSNSQIEEKLSKEIDNQKQYNVQYWPIFDIESEEFIGCCGLRPYQLENQIYEIGFHLRSAYWGKGLGPEAAKAVIDYAFNIVKAKDIFAGHNPNNSSSKIVLERLGFHYIGDEYYEPTMLFHPSYRYHKKTSK
ncbi:MAG: GNAT family N-acetyltransferase [Coprobacillaceae bacterium]